MEQPHSFQINFNSLYTALCEQQRSDQATLLLYTLLHQNANMRTYMLSRTDMDNLVGGIETHGFAYCVKKTQTDKHVDVCACCRAAMRSKCASLCGVIIPIII